jgi:cell migration-inducing and hyaluronan-binding protein
VDAIPITQPEFDWDEPLPWAQCNVVDSATGLGRVPVAGEDVTIAEGVTVRLNAHTAKLGKLLVKGSLVFKHLSNVGTSGTHLKLDATHIVVMSPGSITVGTEANPYPASQKATITLHGNKLSTPPWPYFAIASKTMLVGGDVTPFAENSRAPDTWVSLGADAAVGDTSVRLDRAVLHSGGGESWMVGDEIVITSSKFGATGDNTNARTIGITIDGGIEDPQVEPVGAERRTIAAVSHDGLTLTLTTALTEKHIGTTQVISGQTVDLRASVGVLTRDIVVTGGDDPALDWWGGNDQSTQQFGARLELREVWTEGPLAGWEKGMACIQIF